MFKCVIVGNFGLFFYVLKLLNRLLKNLKIVLKICFNVDRNVLSILVNLVFLAVL